MRNALFHGDIVITRLLSSPSEIEDHRIYVIVTETDMFVERIVASNRMNGLLICISDVDPLERRIVNFSEIKELWRAEGKYSRELSYAVDSINQYIIHFESSIEELKTEIEKIKLLMADRGASGEG